MALNSSSKTAVIQRQVALGAAAAAVVVTVGAQLRRWQWRAWQRAARARAPASTAEDMLRDGFAKKKLPDEIDHVIIGSGLSGLYLAALLSKLGRRVVVLEQHYVAGGCTHTFKDKGFEFDTGVHYVGAATQLTAFMDFGAGRQGAFKLERQGNDDGSQVYNEFHAGGQCVHRFRPGPQTFVQDLIKKFPHEERAIKWFFAEVVASTSGMVLLVAKQYMPQALWKALLRVPGPMRWVAQRYARRTLAEAMTDCGMKNETLRAIISTECGDYGLMPDKAPFFLHAGILTHYLPEGGFSPVGGSDSFAAALVPAIKEAGGAVLVRAPVEKIVVEGGRAVGVEMKGGKGVTRARCSVISSAGVEVTFRKLLPEVDVVKAGGPPASLGASERMGISHHVYGFVGFEGTTEELKLPTYNVWSLPAAEGVESTDFVRQWARLHGRTHGEAPAFLASDAAAAEMQVPAFISFPSAKDSTYRERVPGKSTAVILTEAHANYFSGAGPHAKRGQDYAVIKKRYEMVLLNALYRHFPHLKSKVSYVDVGTPLSNEFYLGRSASYGLDQDADRFLDPTLRASVPGISSLYITGQDIVCCGVFPQVLSAWITLSKVLGVTSPDFWLLFSDFLVSVGRRVLFDRTYAPANP